MPPSTFDGRDYPVPKQRPAGRSLKERSARAIGGGSGGGVYWEVGGECARILLCQFVVAWVVITCVDCVELGNFD